MSIQPIRNLVACALLCLATLLSAACDEPRATPPPVSTPPAGGTTGISNASPTSSSAFVSKPNITISPSRGFAGLEVTVVGSGFPSGTEVDIRLGGPNSGVTTELYASTRAAQHGNIQVSFKMPDKWPNGEKIVLPQILVLASTPDFAQKATAMFEFETRVPSTITPSSGAGISTDKK